MYATIVYTLGSLTVFNIFALNLEWYHTEPWVDIPAHMLFGVLIGLLFLRSTVGRAGKSEKRLLTSLTTLFALTLFLGIGWESIEFLRDRLYAIPRGVLTAQQGVLDTVGDLSNNILGSMMVIFVYGFVLKKWRALKTERAGVAR
ncbi:MAG: hypothetical protein G01um101420_815 [Parcubacteria group bacterium Gr01-1014_20]|nr:MAG: hypothetical protein G01um101420_815 [Parcubacteria group bacterium Gr01-1014_20]